MTDRDFREVNHKLDKVLFFLDIILERMIKMSVELDNLEAKVAAQTSVVAGVELLLTQLSQMIKDNLNSPQRLLALAANVDSLTKRLSDAVVANTPVTPPTT